MIPRSLLLGAVLLGLVSVPVRGARSQVDGRLLTPAPAVALDVAARGQRLPATRARLARANPAALVADVVLLDLFPDVAIRALATGRTTMPGGWLVWTGQPAGDADGSVTFVYTGRLLQGSIRHNGRAYSVEPLAGGDLYEIREVSGAGPELPPLAPPAHVQLDAVDVRPDSDTGDTIDVLVAYTAGARTAAGGSDEAIRARIVLGVAETNQAFANSGVVQRLRLVGAELVGYRESGDIAFDLQQFTGVADGFMDEVHARRDATGADLVQLIVGPGSGGACGVAWLMQSPSTAFAPLAFSVTAYACISPNYTFGHELAHNMGSAHAPDDPSPTPAFPYSYGYKDPGALFRTVMAYDCASGCPRVLYFSNPAVTYGGAPTGTPGVQENARSLNDTRMVVANFRAAREATTLLGAPENFALATSGTTATFSWTPPSSGRPVAYRVEAGSDEGLADLATFTVVAPATALVVPAVPPRAYFVRVRAVDASGPGAPSRSLSLVMTPGGRCIEPAGAPVLDPPRVSGQTVTLTWSGPAAGGTADTFVVGAGRTPGQLDVAIIPTGSPISRFTIDADDGLYFVRVAGQNACGIGEPSNEVAVAVGPAIPGPPAGLSAVVHPGGRVALAWNAATAGGPPTGYLIEAGSATGLADLAVLNGRGTNTSYETTARPRTYFVRVRAVNGAGTSAPSNELIVRVP